MKTNERPKQSTEYDLMTLAQVADYLHYSDRSGALKWLRREDVRMVWRGKRWLIRKWDVDAALERHATGNTVARAREMQSGTAQRTRRRS